MHCTVQLSVCRRLHGQTSQIWMLAIDQLVGVQRSAVVRCADFLFLILSCCRLLVILSDQSAAENNILKDELSKLNSTFSEFREETREKQATSAQRIADLEGQLAAMNATNTGKLSIYRVVRTEN